MSFENGTFSLAIHRLPRPINTSDIVSAFARHALPPADAITGNDPVYGWTTGRHMLDRNITSDAISHGFLRLSLVKAERKLPPALLNAEYRIEEQAEMAARGLSYLKRSERSEIRKQVSKRLIAEQPISLSGIDVLFKSDHRLCYSSATTDSKQDALLLAIRQVTGTFADTLNPNLLAVMNGVNPADIQPCSFSPANPVAPDTLDLGQEFLTWLWHKSETDGMLGLLPTVSVMIDGPLMLVGDDPRGSYNTVISKGNPLASVETKAALLSGKKLARARVTFFIDGDEYRFTWDSNWTLNSVKLPKFEDLDLESRTQERYRHISILAEITSKSFNCFVAMRADDNKWKNELSGIRQWIQDRRA